MKEKTVFVELHVGLFSRALSHLTLSQPCSRPGKMLVCATEDPVAEKVAGWERFVENSRF